MRTCIFYLALILISSVSCKNKEYKIEDNRNLIGFSDELYYNILNYQRNYPVPEVKTKYERDHNLFVYMISFEKDEFDTLIIFMRTSYGLPLVKNKKLYGVYQDDSLYSTIVFDNENRLSKRFINKTFIDTKSLNKLKHVKGIRYSEDIPPIYKYKLKGSKLDLISIDTVFTNWQ